MPPLTASSSMQCSSSQPMARPSTFSAFPSLQAPMHVHTECRALAALLKELCKSGATNVANELFTWLRQLPPTHKLAALCDIYTYTTMIVSVVPEGWQAARPRCSLPACMGAPPPPHPRRACIRPPHCCVVPGFPRVLARPASSFRNECCKHHTPGPHSAQPPTIPCTTHSPPQRLHLQAQCGARGNLETAQELVSEMRARSIPANVHTYSALISVCIKAGELQQAQEVYQQMQVCECRAWGGFDLLCGPVRAPSLGSCWQQVEGASRRRRFASRCR